MGDIVEMVLDTWTGIMLYLLAMGAGFWVLTRLFPMNSNIRWWRREQLVTDLCYWLLLPLVTRYVKLFFLIIGISYMLGFEGDVLTSFYEKGYGPLSVLPIWLQMLLILIISDIPLYWIHRLFHQRLLWPFHAIHHSTKDLDWISTMRFHPFNMWFYATLVDSIVLLMGFAPKAFILLAPFNTVYSAFVHANLNWSLGPLKYVISTPVFHRWHHTSYKEGGNKNFAPTFPVLDMMFGTFYMPKGKLPEAFGADDPSIPEDFVGQMIYPFKKIRKKRSSAESAGPGQTASG